MSNAVEWVKKIYIYIFSAVGLVLTIIGGVMLINLGLKTWVFTKADVYYQYPMSEAVDPKGGEIAYKEPDPKAVEEYQKNSLVSRRQQQAASAVAMILVGAPLFLYHWKVARKEIE